MSRGGRRDNAGQHPGHRFDKRIGTPAEALRGQETAVHSEVAPIDSDNAWLHTAAGLRARGVSYRQIGIRMGRDQEWIAEKLREHPEIIAQKVQALTDPFAPMVPYASEAYYDALTDRDNPQVRAAVAKDVFNRQYGMPESKGNGAPSINIAVVFESASTPVVEASFREASVSYGTTADPSDSLPDSGS